MIECAGNMPKHKPTLLSQIFQKVAPQIGAKIVMEPRWNKVGQIIFKNGKTSYWRHTSLDLNTLGASKIAKDKDYASFFLTRGGFPTVPGKAFFSDSWAKAINSKDDIKMAYKYANQLGLPVIVKPNSSSQGRGVAKVYTKSEFYRAMKFIFQFDDVALVQKLVTGKDYRIVVLDNKIISAYQRIPLNVTGDGKSSIFQLLQNKGKGYIINKRDTHLPMTDTRIVQNLKHQKLTLKSVPEKNKIIYLLDNANLSTGGDGIDVTHTIHPEFKKLAVSITKYMGLRLCGVDLMIAGDISQPPKKYWVLEVNSAPGLDHYLKIGEAQKKIVEDMYLQVLKAMEK